MPMATSQAAAGSGTGVIDSAARSAEDAVPASRSPPRPIRSRSVSAKVLVGAGVASRMQPPSTSGPVAEQTDFIGRRRP